MATSEQFLSTFLTASAEVLRLQGLHASDCATCRL